MAELSALEGRLGYRFADKALLRRALTHKSAGHANNERLEFLGDAVLGYVIGDVLFHQNPDAGEDVLSLSRSHLVRGEALASVADDIELGEHLILGQSSRASGGRWNASILADALEAVIGAVHMDGGIPAARALVEKLWQSRIASTDERTLKDPKTRLQEWLQGHGRPLPTYKVIASEGADHEKRYTVACTLEDGTRTTGTATSRRAAEKEAAAVLNKQMGIL